MKRLAISAARVNTAGIDILALAGTAHAILVNQQHPREDGMAAHQLLGRRCGLVGARLLGLTREGPWKATGAARIRPPAIPRPSRPRRLEMLVMTPLLFRYRETSGDDGGSRQLAPSFQPTSLASVWKKSAS